MNHQILFFCCICFSLIIFQVNQYYLLSVTEIRVISYMQRIYLNHREVCSQFAIVVFLKKIKYKQHL